MATITLPVYTAQGTVPRDFDTQDLIFARTILRSGKGARAAWRRTFVLNRDPIVESHAVIEWNAEREDYKTYAPGMVRRPLYGIRAAHRQAPRRAEVFASARAQVGGLIIPDEHDPRL